MNADDNPALSFDNLHVTASEHCGWMGGVILDYATAMSLKGAKLATTYALIHRISVEAADCIIFPVVPDDAQRLTLCKAIADSAVEEARGRAAKGGWA